jgi:hypothetical protein
MDRNAPHDTACVRARLPVNHTPNPGNRSGQPERAIALTAPSVRSRLPAYHKYFSPATQTARTSRLSGRNATMSAR